MPDHASTSNAYLLVAFPSPTLRQGFANSCSCFFFFFLNAVVGSRRLSVESLDSNGYPFLLVSAASPSCKEHFKVLSSGHGELESVYTIHFKDRALIISKSLKYVILLIVVQRNMLLEIEFLSAAWGIHGILRGGTTASENAANEQILSPFESLENITTKCLEQFSTSPVRPSSYGRLKSASMINNYSKYAYLFSKDFGASMVKLGNIGVLTGEDGETRKNCGVFCACWKVLPNSYALNKWSVVRSAVSNDTRIAAFLLRMHFHDCFVVGCEGSVLLDDTATFRGEKNAIPNLSVGGFDIIDNIKTRLERVCPLTVSCTDILTLATREAVNFVGGPYWKVLLGRRDGRTASETAANNLPSPFEDIDDLVAKFVAKGLNMKDVVVLSGGHTIGFAQCITFQNRLFNFSGTGKPDPTLDSDLQEDLRSRCPNGGGSNSKLAPLDPVTVYKFDNTYYKNLRNNMGLLQSDQTLLTNSITAAMVRIYGMFPSVFARDFGDSMVKMANIGVLTGQDGEIRRNCRVMN
ncbi:hypothetical protein HHK36_008435 [Tetracentron sinense]|uniref:Plant heme peroxidase family profile domain-containing protein n=1 Tax=Tetracentron sinense TaxID=13715 RepID=A0A835DJY2_TETSI|nr:hypothetical protein HHK36_008435 [Tetracentron sinense]